MNCIHPETLGTRGVSSESESGRGSNLVTTMVWEPGGEKMSRNIGSRPPGLFTVSENALRGFPLAWTGKPSFDLGDRYV
jgi:hypothetical protein